MRSLSAKVCAKAGPCALPELDDSSNCEGDCFHGGFRTVYLNVDLYFIACIAIIYRSLMIWRLMMVYLMCCCNDFCDFSAAFSLNDCSLMAASGLSDLFRPTCEGDMIYQHLSMATDIPSTSRLARLLVTTWTTCELQRTGPHPSSVLLTSTSPSYARTSQIVRLIRILAAREHFHFTTEYRRFCSAHRSDVIPTTQSCLRNHWLWTLMPV